MSNELQIAVKRGQVALQDGGDWKTVLRRLFGTSVVEPVETVPFPAVAQTVDLTDEVKDALVVLPQVFNSVEPHVRRALKPAENAEIHREYAALKVIDKVLGLRIEAIKTTVRHHMDVLAETKTKDAADPETTPRDRNGHYLLAREGQPERVDIPGTNKQWSREFRANDPQISGDLLLGMYERGEIERRDYLAMTRATRVFDEDRAFAAVVDDPRRLEILYKIGSAATPTVQLWVRPKK